LRRIDGWRKIVVRRQTPRERATMDLTVVDDLLTTTRSIRRRLDLKRAVQPAVIQECLEIAVQAPIGGDTPRYHFVVVTDARKRAVLADLYRRGLAEIYPPHRLEQVRQTRPMLVSSVMHLADHFQEVPVHIIPCMAGRDGFAALGPDAGPASFYGSIVPATWSLMLALRSRGLGSTLTTSHLRYAREAAALLGIPDDVTQTALLPVAYLTGTALRPARRVAARERTSWDTWGQLR
jgi:nitroreductase